MKNVAANGRVAISAYNAQTMEGYQVKGSAVYVTQGEVVEKFKALAAELFHGACTAKGAVIVTPERVIVTAPGPDNKKEL